MPSSCRLLCCMLVTVLGALALQGCAAVPRGPVVTGFANPLPGSDQAKAKAAKVAQLAGAAAAAGNADAAAGMFEEAALLDPGSRDAALGLGDALLRLGRPGPAAEAFERALQGGANARAQLGYGRALLALNRPEAAIDHLEAARTLTPRDVAVLKSLGIAYDQNGRHDAAAATYRAGLALAPDDNALRTNLGLSLALAGDGPGAIAILRPLAEAPGADARARQNLALAYGLTGDLVASERLSQIDLGADEVRHNLAIFATLRGVDDPTAARALSPAPDDFVPHRAPAPMPADNRNVAGSVRHGSGPSPQGPKPLLGGTRRAATAPTAMARSDRAIATIDAPRHPARSNAIAGARALPAIADAPSPASGPAVSMSQHDVPTVPRRGTTTTQGERPGKGPAAERHPVVAVTIKSPAPMAGTLAAADTVHDGRRPAIGGMGDGAPALPAGTAGERDPSERASDVAGSRDGSSSSPTAGTRPALAGPDPSISGPATSVPLGAGPVIMLAIPPPTAAAAPTMR